MQYPAFKTTDLPPATPEEVEWAMRQLASGYANDFIARGIKNADSNEEALKFLKYHHSLGGGAGPSGGPNNVRYWYEYEGSKEKAHFWFGKRPNSKPGGHPEFVPGGRYVCIRYRQVVKKLRSEEVSPTLF